MRKFIYLLTAFFLSGCGKVPSSPDIRVDGRFADWTGIPPAYSDPWGDATGIDIGRLWMANNTRRLFIRFELGKEISLQTANDLVLYLDTDDNAETGKPVGVLGADLSWIFGERKGYRWTGEEASPVNAYDLGLISAPTTTSRQFEMEFVAPPGKDIRSFLSAGPRIRWMLRDEGSPSGDSAPDPGAELNYLLSGAAPPPYPAISLEKDNPGYLRFLTYNTWWDNLFQEREALFRVLSTIKPDIITFQEVGTHSREEVEEIIEKILGGDWHSAREKDTVTVSRYPITFVRPIDGNLGTLIDLPAEMGPRDIFVINVHLPFGANDRGRQKEVDDIIRFITDAREEPAGAPFPPETPIVIIGDMNMVGESRSLDTLLGAPEGNAGASGAREGPDWDGTALTDLLPYHSGAPESYTWMSSQRTGFGPGRLDLVIYTDSVLEPAKSYIFCPGTMSEGELKKYGLRRDDGTKLSDHSPVVVDFVIKK